MKIDSSFLWQSVEMEVVFFKSLTGAILGIFSSLWDCSTTFFIILSIKKAGLPRCTEFYLEEGIEIFPALHRRPLDVHANWMFLAFAGLL